MFSFDLVYLVLNNSGELKGAFKRKSNAIDSIPENKRNFPKQIDGVRWSYGESHPWFVVEAKIADSNDLPFTGK